MDSGEFCPIVPLETDWATTTNLLNDLRDPTNEVAWSRLVGRFRPIIVRHACRMGEKEADAEDIAQRTFAEFVRAYGAGAYKGERGRLRDWLLGIARHQISNHRRQVARAARDRHAGRVLRQIDGGDALADLWERESRDAVVQLCLERVAQEVDPRTYEAFVLFAVRGLPATEVASRLGMTENAVFLGKRRVLGLMRTCVAQMEAEV